MVNFGVPHKHIDLEVQLVKYDFVSYIYIFLNHFDSLFSFEININFIYLSYVMKSLQHHQTIFNQITEKKLFNVELIFFLFKKNNFKPTYEKVLVSMIIQVDFSDNHLINNYLLKKLILFLIFEFL